MKTRLLFIVQSFGCGGTNKSLQNLLELIDIDKYDISVFALSETGNYDTAFNNCTILQCERLLSTYLSHLSDVQGLQKIYSIALKIIDRVTKRRFQSYILHHVAGNLSQLNFDRVISYCEGLPTLLASMIDVSNKISWIHCDYSSFSKMNNGDDESVVYSKFSHIVCVSDFTGKSFIKHYPNLEDRVKIIFNIVDDRLIFNLANESPLVNMPLDTFKIISVGRIDSIKHFSIIPEIADYLLKRGCQFIWYIVGPKTIDGEYDKLISNIHHFKVEDNVICVGEMNNPYSMMSKSDLLVSTSLSEACPYVINEAKILGVPIVCTNFGSSYEFINNGENGIISSETELGNNILQMMTNKELYCKCKTSLSKFRYDNQIILHKVYSLFD